MKKIISICAVILSLALLITIFAACGKKEGEDTTTTTAAAVATGEYSLEVATDKAIVKKGDTVFQELKYPQGIGYEFDLAYAKEHYEFIDMNFDGNLDLYLAVSKVDNIISYYCWLYNATDNKFDFSASLSALKNISVDSAEQLVLSKTYFNGIEKVTTYEWVDGVLTMKERYGNEGETIPQNIIQSLNDNTIGEVSNTDKTTSGATTQASGDKTTAAQGGNKTTTAANGGNNTTSGNADNKTTTSAPKPTKPLLTTTNPAADGIEVLPSKPNDGWY